MRIEKFPLIYPPRPKGAIHPSTVGKYKGYLAQYKFNDIRLLLYVGAAGKVEILTRKRAPLKSFRVDEVLQKQFTKMGLKKGALHLLDGGVLRTGYGPTLRKPVILWDILIHENEYLTGTTYLERYKLLTQLCGNPNSIERSTGHETSFVVGPDLWLARNFTEDFPKRFLKTQPMEEIEGLVLKNPKGVLEWGFQEENNGDWQIRVRKASQRHLI